MRKLKNRLLIGLTGLCTLISCVAFLAIILSILLRGLPAFRWSFFTEQVRLVGAEGGIVYNLAGTLILISTALCVAAPIALCTSIFCAVYARHSPWRRHCKFLLYLLNGVPSILFGILGLIFFVKFLGWGKSWLAGGILLGVMILPTVAVALLERMESLPWKYVEAAAGAGLTQTQIIWSVVIPQSLGGLVTGSLIGLARAAGETAPIMFTATIFAGATLPTGIKESPVLSLPYHIFVLAQDSFSHSVGEKLWGSALVMVCIGVALSLLALPLRLRQHEESHHS